MTAEISPLSKARAHVTAGLIERAEADPAFRALLLSNPHEAVKSLLGVDPIPGYKITVVEEQPGEVTIVLPAALDENELSDELLDLASGGVSFSAFVDWETWYGIKNSNQKSKKGR
ncbi:MULTISPECIES: NHLP leader peptide family RiPP precursor [Azospirillaceae]|uniref:NHLP leader peptide family RiPP precursor n=1 Tax=Azospirillaceae TaxID=2829815 RepID=UPI000B73BF97|nr:MULTISPECIES: NHLP leader peptide family RiPP precursor [Azospirillaceae]MDG5493371.1 NHLP leader peptide family RiPP precursor [Niveispirillum sp. BGYR6]SNS71217.1 NHLP leader peptide domain-containing protein [Azospirillum sp. RU38E]SNS89365.1 NHLP leader peptide domain-containing protein [Azospirillum sp. RU37A]